MRVPKNGKKVQPFMKKLWDVGREIRVVLKIYFNWKHSPFQFYKKTKNHDYITDNWIVLKLICVNYLAGKSV